jgi:hypothetical protein
VDVAVSENKLEPIMGSFHHDRPVSSSPSGRQSNTQTSAHARSESTPWILRRSTLLNFAAISAAGFSTIGSGRQLPITLANSCHWSGLNKVSFALIASFNL